MKSQNNHHAPTNFWFGFALGSIGAASLAYLFGTKKGRKTLKKLIELAEEIQENSPEVSEGIHTFLQHIKREKLSDSVINTLEAMESDEKREEKEEPQTESLENVMDKIKHISQPKKYVKKFFAKSGKILEP